MALEFSNLLSPHFMLLQNDPEARVQAITFNDLLHPKVQPSFTPMTNYMRHIYKAVKMREPTQLLPEPPQGIKVILSLSWQPWALAKNWTIFLIALTLWHTPDDVNGTILQPSAYKTKEASLSKCMHRYMHHDTKSRTWGARLAMQHVTARVLKA